MMCGINVNLPVSFNPPSSAERLQAIGPTDGLPDPLRRALDLTDGFEPIPVPRRNDWLAHHPEPGQTFDEYVHSDPNWPDKKRNVIYLQPLGDFPKDRSPSLERLQECATAFFGMKVKTLPPVDITKAGVTSRRNPNTGKRQILTGDVRDLVKKTLPGDAFCLLAITMDDLYPDPSWNFVFGEASLRERVGVYSFARYDPLFYGQQRKQDYQKLILWRSCSVLVHETGHMFGLLHCIHFRCILNGSNHLGESDSRALYLCPVCLRKLQYAVGFDVVARYRDLLGYYRRVGFEDEAVWIERRLAHITGEPASRPASEPASH
jgi:archaemetzincin